MARSFAYLVAIMDWHSLKVLSWRVLNVMDADFCIEAFNEAVDRNGALLSRINTLYTIRL